MDNNNGRKSKLVAGLLAIFLGYLGIHNFYLGYTTKGIIQAVGYVVSLLMVVFLSWLIIGLFFIPVLIGIWIWALVEGIFIFVGKIDCDANGIPLAD